MRVGVLSDTHEQLERTRRALEALRAAGCAALVHCGDFTSVAMVTACAGVGLPFVFGNNDADETPALERAAVEAGAVCLGWSGEVELGGRRVAVAHGHMRDDVRRLLAAGPDYLLTGHSHAAHDFDAGGVRRLNPGALHRADVFTVGVLDTETGAWRLVEVGR